MSQPLRKNAAVSISLLKASGVNVNREIQIKTAIFPVYVPQGEVAELD